MALPKGKTHFEIRQGTEGVIHTQKWTSEITYTDREFQEDKLGCDTHALFLVRCCMLFSPLRPEEKGIPSELIRLNWLYSFLLQFVNVVLQLGITYILVLAVEHDEDHWETSYFQQTYGMTMSEVVNLLEEVPGPEDTSKVPKEIMEKCDFQTEHGLRHLSFYYFMIFVWVTKMFAECVESFMIGVRIWSVQEPEFGEELTNEFSCFDEFDGEKIDKAKDKSYNVIRMTKGLKIFLILFVACLRMFIAFSIGYAGMKFIMLQTSYAKVVLKALCMQWVITIDELLVKSFTSAATSTHLQAAKIVYRKAVRPKSWEHGFGGPCLFLIGTSVVLIVVLSIFGDLMELRSECLRITGRGYTRSPWNQFTHEIVEIVN